jgi:hypothetical protein
VALAASTGNTIQKSALVIRVGLAAHRRLPLYPNKQTSLPCVGMSQMCQEATSLAWLATTTETAISAANDVQQ